MNRCMLVLAIVLATGGIAGAQAFPADDQWEPLRCEGQPMTDLFEDEAGALDERDIVGDTGAAAGMRAADAQFLYLRLRLDQDPMPGGAVRPFAWGMEIDLDGDVTDYELLVLVDGTGAGGAVRLYRNTVTTVPNAPTDPADEPEVAMFPAATHARSRAAPGSSFGGDADFFLELAVPWSALMPVGLEPTTPIFVWAASSSTATNLNGDFACHDGRTGEPALDEVASDQTIGDPTVDSDGDGFTDASEIAGGSDPSDPNSVPAGRLEGGGGCKTSGGPLSLAVGLALLALIRASRTRLCRSRR